MLLVQIASVEAILCEGLKNGYNVVGVSRSEEPNQVFLPYRWCNDHSQEALASERNFSFHQVDLNRNLETLLEIIDEKKPSYIVNFAAQGMVAESWFNPSHWYQTNVVSQVKLHDYLRKQDYLKKYVHVTTPEVYGSTDNKWINEETVFNPTTPYAVSRAACDMHLKSFYKAYDFPVVFTRAANVYGPGQQLYRIIPRAMLSARTNENMQLHGGGLSIRSFIHIRDVVKATLKLALHAKPGTTWHLSTEHSISIKELVQKICILSNAKFEDIVQISGDRLGKDQSYLLDSSKIRKEHGWRDRINLDDGLIETLKWVDDNISVLKTQSWTYQHKA